MLQTRPPRPAVARAHEPNTAFRIDDNQTLRVHAVLDQVSAALHAGDVGRAEKHLRVGLDRDPGHPKLQAYLSICIAAAGRDLSAAEHLARDIVRESPQDPAGHYALGCVHLLDGKRRAAFQAFDRARRLGRSDRWLLMELDRMEPRQAPVFRRLARDHFLNVVCGRMRIRWRRRRAAAH